MTSVGKLLRSAREEQKRSLAEIADELCITQRYLRAVENDDLSNLPGVFFYKSFAKQYAAALGIPQSRIDDGLKALAPEEAAPEPAPAKQSSPALSKFSKSNPTRPSESGLRVPEPLLREQNRYFSDRRIGFSAATLAVVLLLCSGFYAWWQDSQKLAREAATSIPGSGKAQPAGKVATVAQVEEEDAADAGVTVPAAREGDGKQHAVLDLSATEETWLSITSEGRVIFSGILEPSETKTLTGIDGAKMKVGNAGGIEIRWKGKPVGPIGPRGQVRTVLLKQDNVEIIKPEPPPASDSAL